MTEKDGWNNKPRDMWTWNVDSSGVTKDLARRLVIYVIPGDRNPLKSVITLEDCNPVLYLHCSDEEPAGMSPLATYRQVREWLKGHKDREWRFKFEYEHKQLVLLDGDEPATRIWVRGEGDDYWSAPTLKFLYGGDE